LPTWTVQKSPNRLVSASALGAVSCPAVNWCVTVGSSFNSAGAEVALAEVGNGTTWTRQPTPRPGGSRWSLFGVSVA